MINDLLFSVKLKVVAVKMHINMLDLYIINAEIELFAFNTFVAQKVFIIIIIIKKLTRCAATIQSFIMLIVYKFILMVKT